MKNSHDAVHEHQKSSNKTGFQFWMIAYKITGSTKDNNIQNISSFFIKM